MAMMMLTMTMGWSPEKRQYAVQHSILRVIDGGKDTRDDHHGEDIGNVKNDAEKVLPPDLFPGQNGRENDGEEKGDEGHADNQQDGVLHGRDKPCITRQHFKVSHAHEGLRGRVGPPLEKGHTEDIQGGQDHKNKVQDNRRGDAQGEETPPAFAAAHGTTPFGSCRGNKTGGGEQKHSPPPTD